MDFKRIRVGLLFLFCLLAAGPARAQDEPNTDVLRQLVALVRPHHSEETKQLLRDMSQLFQQNNAPELAQIFAMHAEGNGFGTGWLYQHESGTIYIITNRHVIGPSGQAEVIFELIGDDMKTFQHPAAGPRIVYVDPTADLAVLRANFPPGAVGITAAKQQVTGGAKVWAAGFPGASGRPVWQASSGHITNTSVDFGAEGRLLQHDATIDPGNSGGPLLRESRTSRSGFDVVGVNVAKFVGRTSANLAIPLETLDRVVAAARKVEERERDPVAQEQDLEQVARLLAAELRSAQPSLAQLENSISNAYIARWGLKAFGLVHEATTDQKEREAMWTQLVDDPIGTMRWAALQVLYYGIRPSTSENPQVDYQGVHEGDKGRIGQLNEVRTNFTINGVNRGLLFTREHGFWRLSDHDAALLPFESGGGGQEQQQQQQQQQGNVEGDSGTTEPVSYRKERKNSGLVIIPRIGFFIPTDWNYISSVSCTGGYAGDPTCVDTPSEFENSTFLGGVDLLGHTSENFRLGGQFLFQKMLSYSTGEELHANVVAEFIWGKGVSFALRGVGGLDLLIAGGDWGANVDANVAYCQSSGWPSCTATKGPFFGGNVGMGLGLVAPFSYSGTAFRTDMTIKYHARDLGGIQVTDQYGSIANTSTENGAEVSVTIGMEL